MRAAGAATFEEEVEGARPDQQAEQKQPACSGPRSSGTASRHERTEELSRRARPASPPLRRSSRLGLGLGLLAQESADAAAQDQLAERRVLLEIGPAAVVHQEVGLERLVQRLLVGPGVERFGEQQPAAGGKLRRALAPGVAESALAHQLGLLLLPQDGGEDLGGAQGAAVDQDDRLALP